MMSEAVFDPFEEVIRKAGEGWMIDWYAPKQEALPYLKQILRRANEWGRQRFGGDAPVLTPEAIVADYANNPRKVVAFLQVLASAGTPQVLVMVWRILQGMTVDAIQMEYEEGKALRLYVRLVSPDGIPEEYESNDIDDAVICRHLGTLKVGEQGIFDGFYPLNLAK